MCSAQYPRIEIGHSEHMAVGICSAARGCSWNEGVALRYRARRRTSTQQVCSFRSSTSRPFSSPHCQRGAARLACFRMPTEMAPQCAPPILRREQRTLSLHALWRCGTHAVQVRHRIQLRDCALHVFVDATLAAACNTMQIGR